DGTDPDADGAVALPAPPAREPAALLLGLLRDRLCVPVVRPETEHLDLRRLLDAIRAGHGRLRGGWLWAASTQVSIPTRSRGRASRAASALPERRRRTCCSRAGWARRPSASGLPRPHAQRIPECPRLCGAAGSS